MLASPPPVTYEFRVVKSKPTTAPHSLGFEYRDGFLYEGTGLAGQVLQKFDVPQPFFGEGITVVPPPALLDVR